MATLAARAFRIDQQIELPADQFEAVTQSSAVFVSASEADRVALSAGYRDAAQAAATVGQMEDALIDEYEITVEPGGLTTRIRGRDPIAKLLDHVVRKRFKRPPERPPVEAVTTSAVADAMAEVVGRFTASQIAQDLVHAIGLGFSWELPRDYELLEDVEVSGRAIDALRTLVEPFTQVQPFRVDILMQNATLCVRQRALTPAAEYTYDVRDARITQLTIRKHKPLKYGLVTLEGRVDSTAFERGPTFTEGGHGGGDGTATGGSGEGEGAVGGDISVAFDLSDEPGTGVVKGSELTESSQQETYDSDGQVLTRTIERRTYRMPDRILIKLTRETYARRKAHADAAWATAFGDTLAAGYSEEQAAAVAGQAYAAALALQLVTRETIAYTWEPSIYDETGPINAPLQLAQYGAIEALRKDDLGQEGLTLTQSEYTAFAYDRRRFLTDTTTLKRVLGKKGADTFHPTTGALIPGTPAQLEDRELVVKALRDVGPLLVEQRTTVSVSVTDPKTKDRSWKLRTVDVQLQGGYRPGGPGRREPPRDESATRGGVGMGSPGGLGTGVPTDTPTEADEDSSSGTDPGDATGALTPIRLEKTISADPDAQPVYLRNPHLTRADLEFLMAQFEAANGKRELNLLFTAASMPWLRKGSVLQFTGLTQEDGVTPITVPPALVIANQLSYTEDGPSPTLISSVHAIAWV